MIRPNYRNELVRHNYSGTEFQSIGLQLAQSAQRKQEAEENKKAAAAQFTDRIKSEEALIGKLSRQMNQGWEMREVKCVIRYNTPNTGIKSILREDTEELLKTESMTQQELQERLFEDPGKAADPEKAIEDNIRKFFGMQPADDNSAPDPEEELQGWTCGGWIVVAYNAETAASWVKNKGHKVDGDTWEMANPDSTVIKNLGQIFDSDALPLRAAIGQMVKQGMAFPMLLQIPEGYLESLHKGQDPEAPPPPPEEKPAKGKRRSKKTDPPPTPPAPPEAPSEASEESEGGNQEEDGLEPDA